MSKISLSDISKVGTKRILDYREISEQYPYCSCAKVLYLLSLKKLDDPDFNKILSRTAISVPDRKYLALLIEKIAPAQKGAAGDVVNNRFFNFTPIPDDVETTAPHNVAAAASVFDKLRLASNNNSDKKFGDVFDNRETADKLRPTSKNNSDKKFGDVFDRAVTDTTVTTTAYTISDTLFGQQNRHISVESVVDLLHGKKTASIATAQNTATRVATLPPVTVSTTNSYIDKFLNNPQEHKPVKVDINKNYSQIKIGENSIKEDLSFGTEAIAKLYAEQGNPKKAIEIYYNLMERHPEKALYYSSFIKKLRV